MAFPIYIQYDSMDCGPTCLRIISKYYGKTYSLDYLRDLCSISREGVSMLGISDAAESIGFHTIGVKISFDKLTSEAHLPCIIYWKQRHFVVVYKINSKSGVDRNCVVFVSDPTFGLLKYSKEEFLKGWISTKSEDKDNGFALLLEPSPDFYSIPEEKKNRSGFQYLFSYLKPYKKFIFQLILGFILGSALQLVFPFLTQSIIDIGISGQNIGFIYLVLLAQMMLFISRSVVEFIRGWILLHIGTRINISLVSDFLAKLMRLPIKFFDIKMTGDILQRINDNQRIESFLTSSTLNIMFSMVNLVIFSFVLAFYNIRIFIVFLLGSAFYATWVTVFLKRRRELDFKRFAQMSDNQSSIIQLVQGMQEIKLNNCEKQKRWEWENIQARLFKVNIKGLALTQYQQAGSVFINEGKNIFISFLAAKAVIDGSITLGMMLAIQYIIGQLNSPIEQMISFVHSTQDAKISLERLGEIHNREDEERPEDGKIQDIPVKEGIQISDLLFRYEGPHSPAVLEDINLSIPSGKITAIVGMSGSGKTTLIKLLLGFYSPEKGEIRIGDNFLQSYSNRMWRKQCGIVMQDGFVFSDTIAKNIAVGVDYIDSAKLLEAVRIANIQEFIESLPLGYNTKIGADGHGLSQGQKQRILIARAVYKDPKYIFLDEATNALDANNESTILQNLDKFFKGRTVVIVAHRLSTVKNADNIVVLNKGKIVEMGIHDLLTRNKGAYYSLVKNQLELGN